ncbi:MAG: hypothetical protein GY775_18590 [Candidatus Scalindua sp.]|nr:hypothetical protein [Candidatus Scalindua sp.]
MAKNRNTDDSNNKGRDRIDLIIKLASPLMVGVLIAWAGYVSESTLGSISSREESARLITELQVKREQSETDLRRGVFDQALQSFFKKSDEEGVLEEDDLKELSKQMLRLEMLSLNFGDSLSLSPLFNEFRRDLDDIFENDKKVKVQVRVAELKKRLTSLAKRVASNQITSVVQHGGVSLTITIPLQGLTLLTECDNWIHKDYGYKWPVDEMRYLLGYEREAPDDSSVFKEWQMLAEDGSDKGILEIDGKKRRIELHVTNVDRCNKNANVNIGIWPVDNDGEPYKRPRDRTLLEVERQFELDFFNFPMVDNTRLAQNQRFSLIMENFNIADPGFDDSSFDIAAVIFPAEYASVRDRPGMKEALELLQTALKSSRDKEEKPWWRFWAQDSSGNEKNESAGENSGKQDLSSKDKEPE